MHKHNNHTLSTHRRIVSSTIKPSVSRITSSQSRSYSQNKQYVQYLNQSPYQILDPTILQSQERSQVPIKIVEKYINESYLMNNHEKIVSVIENMSSDVKKNLQFNNIEVQELQNNFYMQDKDPKLLFRMFEALNNLDKNIVQQLFSSQNQVIDDSNIYQEKNHPKNRFRFDTFQKMIDILNELISNIIKVIEDKGLAIFIEQIWKLMVVILDLNTQWSKERYQSLVNGQIESFRETLNELKNENKQLEEKVQKQQRTYQMKLAIEQKRNMSLREENNKICQNYNNLEDQINELSNIEHAKGDLQNINQKLHEMDYNFIKYNKEINESQKQASTSIKQLARLLTVKQPSQKCYLQQKYEQLNIMYKEQKSINYFSINPIISQLDIDFFHIDQVNQKQSASDFLQFLFFNLSSYPYQSGAEIFLQWIHNDEQQYVNARTELLIKLNSNNGNDDYISTCQLILGMSNQQPPSFKVLEETIKLIRLLEMTILQQNNQQRSSIFIKYSNVIDFELETNISNYQTLMPQNMLDCLILNFTDDQKQKQKIIQITYQLLIYLINQEKANWNHLTKFFITNANKFNYKLELPVQFYNLDIIMIWQLLIIHLKNNSTNKHDEINQIDDFFQQIHMIWLYRPRCIIKFATDTQLIQSNSPTIKKANSLLSQKPTPQLRKQNTMLSETSKRK